MCEKILEENVYAALIYTIYVLFSDLNWEIVVSPFPSMLCKSQMM